MNQLNKPQFTPLNNDPLPVSTPTLLRNIEDFIKTVVINPVVAPAFTPKNFNNQFQIRMDLKTAPTVKRLYIYSFETKIWSYITLT